MVPGHVGYGRVPVMETRVGDALALRAAWTLAQPGQAMRAGGLVGCQRLSGYVGLARVYQ